MTFRLAASKGYPKIVHDLDGDPAGLGLVEEPVRLYIPRDGGMALLDVVILGGEFAGRRARVGRDVVLADPDRNVRTQQELTVLAAEMAAEGFLDEDRQEFRRLPFEEGEVYCWARGHQMAQWLKNSGYRVGKLILIDHSFLVADSIYGQDLTKDHHTTAFYWSWHIAPVVYVGDASTMAVIDPALLPTAQSPQQWMARMNVSKFITIDYPTMVNQLELTHRFPESTDDLPWLVTADEDVLGPPSAENPTLADDVANTGTAVIAAALAEAAGCVPRRLAIGYLNLLRNNWLAAEASGGTTQGEPPGYRADYDRATSSLAGLSDPDQAWVKENYPMLLGAVWQTFSGTGVAAGIATLLTNLKFEVGVQ